ncbi:MAG: hypothetical protein FWH05_06235 [Oscillospiraceae bacterium]|nr:hypothetical protein [Oscillospiraceae bacterium]
MAKFRVAVLFGGASKDYPVSCRSAYNIISKANTAKFDIMPIGITKSGRWLYFPGDPIEIQNGTWEENSDCCSAILSPDPHHGGVVKILPGECEGGVHQSLSFARIDAVFPVLHGKYGECGRIQSLCWLSGVKLIGSNYTAANACNDKIMSHLLLNTAGIKTINYQCLERDFSLSADEMVERLPLKLSFEQGGVFVKAASCSSSIGANIANNMAELSAAIKLAFSHDNRVVIEQSVEGRELLCAVCGNEYSLSASEIGEIVPGLALGEKYIQNTAEFIMAKLEPTLENEVKDTAKRAFKALGCKTYALVKFKLSADSLYCTGVEHLPGLSENSVFVKLTAPEGGDILSQLTVDN